MDLGALQGDDLRLISTADQVPVFRTFFQEDEPAITL
jgi:hypothetical protein